MDIEEIKKKLETVNTGDLYPQRELCWAMAWIITRLQEMDIPPSAGRESKYTGGPGPGFTVT